MQVQCRHASSSRISFTELRMDDLGAVTDWRAPAIQLVGGASLLLSAFRDKSDPEQ